MSTVSIEKYNWIRLALCENVGPITFRDLISFFKTPENALQHIDDFARRGGRSRPIKIAPTGLVDAIISRAEALNAGILTFWDADYSKLLAQIEDKPPVLFTLGDATLLNRPAVSLVGSRNSSINGQNLTKKISFDLANNGYVVVSGMARGIDTAAHTGALHCPNPNGGTIAVLGTGVDVVYPEENQHLYDEIKEKGCLVSELPFGTGPIARNFPRRNRIISGLSQATVVIEAQLSSGSLITAKEALSQNREVMAVPGSPLDPRSEGPNHLIQEGAALIQNADDILYQLSLDHPFELTEAAREKDLAESGLSAPEKEIEQAQTLILQHLTPEVTNIDTLIQGTNLPVDIVNVVLVQLELAGRIERFAGNKISLLYTNE